MKKVLIISHLPISEDTNVGKTLRNLFSSYPPNDICQIFFTDVGKTNDNIQSYKITDADVLNKHILLSRMATKRKDVSFSKHNNGIHVEDKRSPYKLLLRDYLWKNTHVIDASMRKWLEETRPECIFLAPGYSMFAYDLARKISNMLGIKLFIYFMEDFYNEDYNEGFWYSLRIKLFRRTLRNCVKQSSGLFVLNEAIENEYSKEFNKPITTVYNPAPIIERNDEETMLGNIITMMYGGSVGKDRIDVIEAIGRVVYDINQIKNNSIVFNYFGGERTPEILDRIKNGVGINYKGKLQEKDLLTEISNSQILVHVESFEEKYIAKTRRALSTKIPEYLASNNLILCVGPKGIESVEYLRRHNAAVIVDDINMLKPTISSIVENYNQFGKIRENAVLLSRTNHNKTDNQNKLYTILNS